MKEIQIGANDAGQRLDKFLQKYFTNLPKSMMYKAIRNKKIKINRKRCQFDQQLKEGDIVLLFLPPEFLEEKVTEIPLYTGNLDVIYEDSDILIVNKEAGLLSQSDQAGQQDTLVGRVQYYLYAKKEYDPEQENSFTPALCHRLDKNTQGLVIAAKNARALRIMNQAIKERKIQKYYYAVVEGTFSQKDFSITCFIKKEQTKALVSRSYKEGYKEASMDVHVMDSNPNGSLIQVLLKTGRFHQIRASMAFIGHPLTGDHKYGYQGPKKNYILCAYRISIQNVELDLPQKDFLIPNLPFKA